MNMYYGGTFDPIHKGHLAVATAAQKSLHTDVVFLPSADPPHRAPTSASAIQRAEMVELAIAGHEGFSCDQRELKRSGKSYSIDTLRSLRAELGPHQPIVWLIGMDAFLGLDTWHDWLELFSLCHFVIAQRPEQSLDSINASLQQESASRWLDKPEALQTQPAGSLYVLPLTLRYESSTAIRKDLANRGVVHDFLPKSVAEYIQIHQLYASRV
jgi:nicotinate-nucleotide adenylyltransferase